MGTHPWGRSTPAFPLGSFLPADRGGRDTIETVLQLPDATVARAAADSDSVAVTVSMTYDTGTPAEGGGCIWIVVVDRQSRGTPEEGMSAPDVGLRNAGPYPFRPVAQLRLRLVVAERGILAVHDAAGSKVATLLDAPSPAGANEATWTGRTDDGRRAAPRINFFPLSTSRGRWTAKGVLLL